MNLLIWILFGVIIGIVVGWIIKDKRGFIVDIVVGIIGFFLGGWVVSGFKNFIIIDILWLGFFIFILGVVVFISILKLFKKR